MNTQLFIFTCAATGILLGLILYVVFGQVTVRRLRKIPEIKNCLGLEFVSGWDIFNVAQALSLPRSITKRLSESPISSFYADTELLIKHTSPTERLLAKIFFWVIVSSASLMILLSITYSVQRIL